MAKQTKVDMRGLTIYQVFPRQHSEKQNFEGVIDDLDRIANMGVDIIYLLPFHPIGKVSRKGLKGSPYSIVDFYKIDKDLGTLEDLKRLVEKAHKKNMKVMMDIVFNHTSKDSVLTQEHPEWFYRKSDGSLANRVGDWSDITDLNYDLEEVQDYFVDVLVYWASIVDGFRCDVAPLLPIDFWIKARKEVEKNSPDIIWLTESVHPEFIKYIRDQGYDCSSDGQMYDAFDMCYEYDIFDFMDAYLLKDSKKLSRWLEEIYRQEMIYPKNYIKIRGFENHDQRRLRDKVRDHKHFMNMLTMMFFLKGTTFIYAGLEHEIDHLPNLFEDDVIVWNPKQSLETYIKKLTDMKKEPIFSHGVFNMHAHDQIAVFSYEYKEDMILGIFNLENLDDIEVPLTDGSYEDFLSMRKIEVNHGKIKLDEKPIIIKTHKGRRR
ncbi:alpha-amylase family glycosyl hydrolase [Mariniplasma anaerobium]|uniref:Alpha-amylase n=1 Tax=Mariniplasma anaerobium TaxID=2735436 RepID=A0A7U9TM37_9MOLU|nr:alpha-amylase family glycosyl hydrolase [Mariniplasma anaerobium]BCR36439.1 alpha-amylase [Mariniplasma anaerobium]